MLEKKGRLGDRQLRREDLEIRTRLAKLHNCTVKCEPHFGEKENSVNWGYEGPSPTMSLLTFANEAIFHLIYQYRKYFFKNNFIHFSQKVAATL